MQSIKFEMQIYRCWRFSREESKTGSGLQCGGLTTKIQICKHAASFCQLLNKQKFSLICWHGHVSRAEQFFGSANRLACHGQVLIKNQAASAAAGRGSFASIDALQAIEVRRCCLLEFSSFHRCCFFLSVAFLGAQQIFFLINNNNNWSLACSRDQLTALQFTTWNLEQKVLKIVFQFSSLWFSSSPPPRRNLSGSSKLLTNLA